MKHIILLSILCLPLLAFAQQNTFRYKGELPTEKFWYYGEDTEDINYENADKIALRNRIYVMFDSTGTLFLNGHEVKMGDFEKSFKYVLTNPDKLEYLPENVENAVVFSNSLDGGVFSDKDNVTRFKEGFILVKISSTYINIMEEQLKNNPNMTWENLTTEDIVILEKNRLNIAIVQADESPFEEEIEDWEEVEEVKEKPLILKKRNVFTVLINANDELLVRDELTDIAELRAKTKEFILNPSHDENLSEGAVYALVYLKTDSNASAEFYWEVFNELKAAYNEIWNQIAIERYGLEIKYLREDIQKEIRNDYPMTIRE